MVSYKDIAGIAKVSTTTVSHVINETRFVGPETRKRVREAMEQLNYTQPNLLAKSLLTGRSNTIGLVISDIRNPFYPEVIQGIEEIAQKEGYNLFLSNTNYGKEVAIRSIKALAGRRIDGIIIAASQIDNKLIREIFDIGVNIVLVDWEEKNIGMDNLYFNYKPGIKEVVDYLVSLGHRDFLFISGPLGIDTSNIRLSCFKESVEKHQDKMISYKIIEGTLRIGNGKKIGKEILGLKKMPTAIVCSNDITAIGIMNELISNNIKIPEDVSITGLDNIRLSELVNPPLTTIELDRYKIGQTAIEFLLNRIEDKDIKVQSKVFNTKMIKRKSVAKARK